jgi:hypothetical protein
MAQRQRRDGRDSFSIMHYFWQIAPDRAAEPLSDWSWCWAALAIIFKASTLESPCEGFLVVSSDAQLQYAPYL